jgi:hypothetical protein
MTRRPLLAPELAAIRADLAAGMGVRAIARKYGRNPSHISAIRSGKARAEGPTTEARLSALEAAVVDVARAAGAAVAEIRARYPDLPWTNDDPAPG